MEKAFAYICTAADTAPRLLKRYCRKVYELGYVRDRRRRKEKHHLHHPRWSCQNQGSRRIKPFLTLPFLADIMKAGKQGKFVMRISL